VLSADLLEWIIATANTIPHGDTFTHLSLWPRIGMGQGVLALPFAEKWERLDSIFMQNFSSAQCEIVVLPPGRDQVTKDRYLFFCREIYQYMHNLYAQDRIHLRDIERKEWMASTWESFH
jgi:hypothetical protein